jgi:protein SCO1/2
MFPRWFARTLAGLALVLGVAVGFRSLRPAPLPVLGHVPPFHLTDARGAAIGADALEGHPSVVDFIFTRCMSSCPRLTATMATLQSRLAAEKSSARLFSFSVDPENDTPQVLARYAAEAHADPARWTFVTGPADDVERAVVFGFKVSAAKIARGANEYDVTHGDWFVLVDGRGDIRGYYATDEAGGVDALVRDIRRLER